MNGTFIIEEKFLDEYTRNLFFDLERLASEVNNQKVSAQEFAAGVLKGEDNLEDLKLAREILQRKKVYSTEQMLKDRKYYTSEEIGRKLGL
jgi:hypothetical protein